MVLMFTEQYLRLPLLDIWLIGELISNIDNDSFNEVCG